VYHLGWVSGDAMSKKQTIVLKFDTELSSSKARELEFFLNN
jgi:hypothetical protein